MFDFEKINLSFSLSPLLFITALLLLAGYTFYIYRYTVPPVNPGKKFFLVFIRTIALLILLFIFFEPVLTLARKVSIEPLNLIFVDNSRSVKINDGTNREEKVNQFISDAVNSAGDISLFHTFGNNINEVTDDSLSYLSFNEGTTNFSQIVSSLSERNENISSVTIISDGVITSGNNPVFTAEKTGIPFFTIGIGDTTARNDIEIRNVLYNEYIYAENPTTISAYINNNGFAGKNVSAALYESNRLIGQQEIQLTDNVDNVSFSYTPAEGGEKKLTLTISELDGEFTFANNRKVFYINVLDNKLNVLILSGSPSPDLTFIKNSLALDENISIKSITEISRGKYVEKQNNEQALDSAEILFLIGYPSQLSKDGLLRRTAEAINKKAIPYFMIFTEKTDAAKLRLIEKELSFTTGRTNNRLNSVQPDVKKADHPLLKNNAPNPVDGWNRLPPVLQPDYDFKPKPEGEVLSAAKSGNIPSNSPLIISRKLGNKKSVTVLAQNIWKWKLQTATRDLDLFDNFINNSVKWLNTSEEQKQVNITTTKKVYSSGEEVEFNAQVYDETFNPVPDAEVELVVKSKEEEYKVLLNSLGGGLYEGSLQPGSAGDYSFFGTAISRGNKIGEDKGNFNIGEIDIEMTTPNMNMEMLSVLAEATGGNFYIAGAHDEVFDKIRRINASSIKEKTDIKEFNLWSNEWLLVIAIILFGIEWFTRKRTGML